jgi:hypothetical protein
MASASFSSVALPTLQPISEMFMRSNFLIWKALVLSALKGAQISEFLFGTTEAPAEYLAGDDKKKKMLSTSAQPRVRWLRREAAASPEFPVVLPLQEDA